MKRGRRTAKNAEAFNAIMRWEPTRREFLIGGAAYALSEFSTKTRINPGTLSGIAAGHRFTIGYADRYKVIKKFPDAFRPGDAERFLDDEHLRLLRESPLILLDPSTSPHSPLDHGQRLLVSGSYDEAIREFEIVYRAAGEQQDYPLQADAAARIAWAWFEQGIYTKSMDWVRTGVGLIEKHTGGTLDRIMNSIRPGSQSSLCPLSEEASHVLSRLLQIQYKLYIESVIYFDRKDLRLNAMHAVEQSIRLDRHLQLSSAIGHDLRWQAVLIISDSEPQKVWAKSLLDESRELFGDNSLGAAYLARDRGIFNWQMQRYQRSDDSLRDAIDRLASYADSRALGPTFHVLSKVAWESRGNPLSPKRYSLAGAALHPYGFVLNNAREWLRSATEADKRHHIDELMSGRRPFEKLVPVLSGLTDGSSSAVTARLEQNLSRILGRNVQSWLHGSAVPPQR